MLKELGITKTTPFVIINQTLKTINKRLSKYPWYEAFKTTKIKIGNLAKKETLGEKISKEERDSMLKELDSYKFHKNLTLDVVKGKVYDFNTLKEIAKGTDYKGAISKKEEKSFDGLARNVESMNKLQGDLLPTPHKKSRPIVFKEKGNALLFIREFNQYKIYEAFPLAYQVYPCWVVENIPVAGFYLQFVDEEQIRDWLASKEKELGKRAYKAQKMGGVQYYAFLPEVKFAIHKIVLLGKKYQHKLTGKQQEKNEQLRSQVINISNELAVLNQVYDTAMRGYKTWTEKLENYMKASKSPSVSLSALLPQINEAKKNIEDCKNSKNEARAKIKELEARLEEIKQQIRR